MSGIPMGRKFGGPEIALIAVAMVFAVAMTAWWHELYQQADTQRAVSHFTASSTRPSVIATSTTAEPTFTVTAYVHMAEGAANAFANREPRFLSAPMPVSDPNQM